MVKEFIYLKNLRLPLESSEKAKINYSKLKEVTKLNWSNMTRILFHIRYNFVNMSNFA